MPVVLTDFTNKTWCVEQPNDGYIHVGWVGKPGPKLVDVLEFIQTKQEQFDKFLAKKREEELAPGNRRIRRGRGIPKNRGDAGAGEKESSPGE